VLATAATRLAHGAEEAAAVAETARLAFEEGEAADTLPSVEVSRGDLAAGIPAFRLFALAGLAGSNGEARRLIRGGGARINDVPVQDEGLTVTVADLHDDAIKLSAGRKHHRLVRAP
jgi:tyrosyl-tRNA synthetase